MSDLAMIVMMINAALASLFIQGYHGGYGVVLANMWFIASLYSMSLVFNWGGL